MDAAAVFREGQEALPSGLSLEQLVAYLEARPDANTAFASDLYLAAACLAGEPVAIAEFHRRYLSDIGPYLGSLASSVDLADVSQQLAVRLLVRTEGAPPRLAEYSGRGSLEGWIRIAASRLALDTVRGRKRADSTAAANVELAELASRELDGELLLLRERYRAEFQDALVAAIEGLPAEERVLLRLHYLEKVTTAALAALYRVSRNTIVRRIASARTSIFEATLARVAERVGVPADRQRTLLELVRSHIDVSIERLLRDP